MAQEQSDLLKYSIPIDTNDLYTLSYWPLFYIPEPLSLPAKPVSVPQPQPIVSSTTSPTSKSKRRRSADRTELKFHKFMEFHEFESDEKIRIWKNDRNIMFYDCSCNSRKPTHDLKKIKTHLEKIHPKK
jgi:hypothetical protein